MNGTLVSGNTYQATTLSALWPSNLTNGNSVYVLLVVQDVSAPSNSASVLSVSDSNGNTFVRDKTDRVYEAGSSLNVTIGEVWRCDNVIGGNKPTVTVQYTRYGSDDNVSTRFVEVSGTGGAAIYTNSVSDAGSDDGNASIGSISVSGPTLSAGAAIVFGVLGGGTVPDSDVAFGVNGIGHAGLLSADYIIPTSSSTFSPSWNFSGNAYAEVALVVAYGPAAAATGQRAGLLMSM